MLDDDENTIIPDIKITKSESGWFEINLSYNFDGEVYDLASKIQLFPSQNEIEADEKKYFCLILLFRQESIYQLLETS